MKTIRRGIRILFFVLGWFEMMMVIRILTSNQITLQNEQKYFPQEFFRSPVKNLFAFFTFGLGLIRLIWSVGDNTLPAWLFVTAAHIGETVFVWTCAQLPHFNPFRKPFVEVFRRVLTLEAGNVQSRFALLCIPMLVVLLLIHGPGDSRVTTRTKVRID